MTDSTLQKAKDEEVTARKAVEEAKAAVQREQGEVGNRYFQDGLEAVERAQAELSLCEERLKNASLLRCAHQLWEEGQQLVSAAAIKEKLLEQAAENLATEATDAERVATEAAVEAKTAAAKARESWRVLREAVSSGGCGGEGGGDKGGGDGSVVFSIYERKSGGDEGAPVVIG